MINPVEGVITSSYGERTNPVLKKNEFHDGIDIACVIGTEVLAADGGIVSEVGLSVTYGNYIKYNTDSGYTIMYAHLSKLFPKTGERIEKGQITALSGNTGLTTGAHLHYGMWKNGVGIDPMNFVNLPYTDEVIAEYTNRGTTMK